MYAKSIRVMQSLFKTRKDLQNAALIISHRNSKVQHKQSLLILVYEVACNNLLINPANLIPQN